MKMIFAVALFVSTPAFADCGMFPDNLAACYNEQARRQSEIDDANRYRQQAVEEQRRQQDLQDRLNSVQQPTIDRFRPGVTGVWPGDRRW